MLCTNFTVITNPNYAGCRGRCQYYQVITDARDCKPHDNQKCYKYDAPIKKNGK